MDALMGYGNDDSDEESSEEMQEAPSTRVLDSTAAAAAGARGPSASKPAAAPPPQNPAPGPPATSLLPPPDFDGSLDDDAGPGPGPRTSWATPSLPSSGAKRPLTQAQGAGPQQALPKSLKPATGSKPGVNSKTAAALLPPQLRGRSNVVTEDVDKLFTKRSLAAAKAAASAKSGGPSS